MENKLYIRGEYLTAICIINSVHKVLKLVQISGAVLCITRYR